MSDATRVFLVGAGPGDPGLVTVRAAELLARADLVLYDQLVSRRILDLARPGAECVGVRDLPGASGDRAPLVTRMIEAAGAGRVVVRLKSGDPLTFGRGGEEADALRVAGVRYEIVPGVTAALAAAAYLELPLARRAPGNNRGALALITGHDLPAKPGQGLDWAALARFPGALSIYMGLSRLPLIAAELLKHGRDPTTPAGVVERASTGAMRSVFAPLGEIDRARRNAGLEAPGLILVGESLALRPEKGWFVSLPLFGHRVLVTRPAGQAEQTMRDLERLGAVASRLSTLEIRPPADWAGVDSAIHALKCGGFDWVAFTSANGVRGLCGRVRELGFDARAFGSVSLAAVGPKTAESLAEFGLRADFVPENFDAEALAAGMIERVAGKRVLFARAGRGRETLIHHWNTVAAVTPLTVYEQVDAAIDSESELFASLRRGEIGLVLVGSANAGRGLVAAFDETLRGRVARNEVRLIAISPAVAEALCAAGCPASAVATAATGSGLVAATVRLVTSRPEAR